MDISNELETAKAEIDKEVQNFLAFLNVSKNTQLENAQDYLIAVRERQADLLTKQGLGQNEILLKFLGKQSAEDLASLHDAFENIIKRLHSIEERVGKHIEDGLAALKKETADSIAAIRAERDRGMGEVRKSIDMGMASLEEAAEKSLAIITG